MKKRILPITLILFVLPLAYAVGVSPEQELRSVPPGEFFSELERARENDRGVILDVRTPGEYQAGHAPGSVNLDFYAPNFRSQLEMLDKDEEYFVYCRSGNRSGQTLKLMESLGFTKAYDLIGGWSRSSEALSSLEAP